MHILLAIVGVIASIAYVASRLSRAARDGQDVARDVGGVVRRQQWNRKISKRLVENLSDPREAAIVLLVQTATYEGALTDAQQGHIVDLMIEHFQCDSDTAEQLLAFGRMAVGEINDAANSLTKILRPIEEVCRPNEKQDLVTMLEAVAAFNTSPIEQQTALIDRVRRKVIPLH